MEINFIRDMQDKTKKLINFRFNVKIVNRFKLKHLVFLFILYMSIIEKGLGFIQLLCLFFRKIRDVMRDVLIFKG